MTSICWLWDRECYASNSNLRSVIPVSILVCSHALAVIVGGLLSLGCAAGPPSQFSCSSIRPPLISRLAYHLPALALSSSCCPATPSPPPLIPPSLADSSYDAHLRLFDTRSPARPLLELELPGGIWRTRWHPSPARRGDILNACMHGGFAVARLSGGDGGAMTDGGALEGEVTHTFPGTLGYGADWCRLPPAEDGSLVATCSFYDHVMNVWRA